MSEAEKDTREVRSNCMCLAADGSREDCPWKCGPMVLVNVNDVERLRAALTAALEERDERLTLEESGTLTRLYDEHKERAEQAEATLAEARALVEEATPWLEAHPRSAAKRLARQMREWFEHGRLPS